MKLHAATSFTDVTEGDFICKLEISSGVYLNSGNVEIVVGQENINRIRGTVLSHAGCIVNGNPSFAEIDNGADCNSGGSREGNDAVYNGIALVMAAVDKIRRNDHVPYGCSAGVAHNLRVRLPLRAWIEWFMPKKPRSAKVIIGRFYLILNCPDRIVG